MKQASYPLHKLNIARAWKHENTFKTSFQFRSWLSNVYV